MQALSKAEVGGNYTIQWLFGLPEVVEFLHRHHVEVPENLRTMAGSYIVIIIAGLIATFRRRRSCWTACTRRYHYAFGDSCNLSVMLNIAVDFVVVLKTGVRGKPCRHGFGTGVGVC